MGRKAPRVPRVLARAALLTTAAALSLAAPNGCSPRGAGFDPLDGGAGDGGSTPVDANANTEAHTELDGHTEGPDEGPVEGPDGEAPREDAAVDDTPLVTDVGPAGPVDEVVLLTGAPADAASRFGGPAMPSRAPTLVYPADGTVIPPNLPSFEVHFRPAAGTSLFELTLEGTGGRVRVYSRCASVGDGCAFALDTATMALVARASHPGDGVRISIAATDAMGTFVSRSATRDLGVTGEELRGGVYYWSASAGAIVRYEFGLAGARPETFLRGDPINCVGCHALSRDGTHMFVGRFIPGTSANALDVASRATTSGNLASTFATFSPDSSRLLTSNGSTMVLRNGTTGAPVSGLANNAAGTMPDWSPDGANVVFVIPAQNIGIGNPGHSGRADLFLLPWRGTAFGAPTILARSPGDNFYYPSFAPDNRWVIFNRAAESSYDAADAHLWAVEPGPAGAAGTPVQLTNADGDGDRTNSWPRFAPFTQTFRGETLYWFTFSSRRDYGLRLVQETRARDFQKAQLWMAGFLPSRAASGDPSTPAFWVPFQDLSSGNHIAQWTQQVRRRACMTDAQCASGERCRSLAASGYCVGN